MPTYYAKTLPLLISSTSAKTEKKHSDHRSALVHMRRHSFSLGLYRAVEGTCNPLLALAAARPPTSLENALDQSWVQAPRTLSLLPKEIASEGLGFR